MTVATGTGRHRGVGVRRDQRQPGGIAVTTGTCFRRRNMAAGRLSGRPQITTRMALGAGIAAHLRHVMGKHGGRHDPGGVDVTCITGRDGWDMRSRLAGRHRTVVAGRTGIGADLGGGMRKAGRPPIRIGMADITRLVRRQVSARLGLGSGPRIAAVMAGRAAAARCRRRIVDHRGQRERRRRRQVA